jgi:hypothetical protein
VDAGLKCGALSLASGRQHPILQMAADEHAIYQAVHRKQGHQEWDIRFQRLSHFLSDCTNIRECCAESWPEQNDAQAAVEMFTCWRFSPGHWASINGPCSYWGYAMSWNERWYACAILADLRVPK